ncbi:MAG: hypothetical protein M3Q16_00645 [Pseudomonadota bacterium]|nr:hypothetical protein [Pseudomonadota bacterium]
MIKNTETQRRHKIYLRAKNALRDQHQDTYALMLERHARELDTLWANYNLAVKKLASEHNKAIKSRAIKSGTIKSKVVPLRKERVLSVEAEEKVIH